MDQLLLRLRRYGGSIMRTDDVSPEIERASRTNGWIFVDGEGASFVWVPKDSINRDNKISVGWLSS